MNKTVKIIAILLAAAVTPSFVFALGVRIPSQDAYATARGEAYTATADDPSAIYYNPAGITQLDNGNVSLGIYAISLSDHYTSSKSSFDTKSKISLVPELYYTQGLKDIPLFKDIPITVGLGAYSPYGLSFEWPHNTPFNTLGQKGSIEYITVNPVIAWQIAPTFSVAAGATINDSTADLEYDVLPTPLPSSAGQIRFRGSDVAAGFNVGARWQPQEQFSFGFNYRSATTMSYHGTLADNSARGTQAAVSTADFNFPQTFTAGISWRPTTNWNAEFDADRADWSTLKTLNPSISTPINLGIPGVPPLTKVVKTFNWKPSWLFEFGLTRTFDNGLRASGGYIYSQNSVPTDAGFSPLIPDSDRHIWSLGLGGKYKSFTWDATYQLAWGPARNVTASTPDPLSKQTANGKYEFLSHAILISLGYHF